VQETPHRIVRGDLAFDVRVGGPDDGDAVLLLHGFPQDASCWDAVARRLQAAGLHTIAPDQRGYSPEARPTSTAAYRMHHLVGDALAILDDLGADRAHVVGHDWGGAVAWALAMRSPDRVRSLTVVSTPHPVALGHAMRSSWQALRSWYVLVLRLPIAERIVAPRLVPLLTRFGLPESQARHYQARMAEPGALTGAIDWYRAMPFTARSPSDQSGDDAASDRTIVTVPTTYVWGNRDPALGRRAAELTVDHVSADYRFVELDAGHWLPENEPDELAAAILDRIAGTT